MKVSGSISPAPKRLAALLVLLLLLPVLSYTVWEFATISDTERMLRESYERQLDVILFSINQRAWDVSAHWTSILQTGLWESRSTPDSVFHAFLEKTASVECVVFLDTTFAEVLSLSRRGRDHTQPCVRTLPSLMQGESQRFRQLVRYSAMDYRKIEPLVLPADKGPGGTLALVFAVQNPSGKPGYVAMVIREAEFIRNVIGPRLSEMAGEDLVVAAFRTGDPVPVASSGDLAGDTLSQRRALWLLPGHAVGIGPRGATVDQLVRRQLYGNLTVLILLDLVLLVGAVIVYRSVRTQVALARAKSTFVSNVSHELRTPLALIRMFAETLEMGRLKDERKKQEYYGTILRETERLTHLVNNILNFSRMEAGRKQYHFRPVDANDLVRGVLTTYGPHLQQQGITPDTSFTGDPLLIQADADAVTEAILNLIDNGIKYGGEKKFLAVRTRRGGNTACIEVEDHGIGIAPDHQNKIFEAFYRVPTGLVHETKGSGIGLSLVQHIMTAHKGSVEVKSTPGSGSLFRLVFPVSDVAPEPEDGSPAHSIG